MEGSPVKHLKSICLPGNLFLDLPWLPVPVWWIVSTHLALVDSSPLMCYAILLWSTWELDAEVQMLPSGGQQSSHRTHKNPPDPKSWLFFPCCLYSLRFGTQKEARGSGDHLTYTLPPWIHLDIKDHSPYPKYLKLSCQQWDTSWQAPSRNDLKDNFLFRNNTVF